MMRHLRRTTLVALFVVIPAAIAAGAPFAFVTNSALGTVSIIDTSMAPDRALSATVPIGGTLWGLALTPGGNKLYIADQNNGVLVFDTASRQIVKAIPVGSMPFGVAASPDGDRVYVTRFLSFTATSPSLVIIDTSSDEVVGTVAAGRFPNGVAVHASGKVYVAVANGLAVVNGGTVVTKPAGSRPFGVAVNAVLQRVYVTNKDSHNVSVFNAADDQPITTIPVETNPHGIAVSPDGHRVFVANNGSGTVTIINADTNTVVGHVAVGTKPYGLQVAPDGQHVYVANWGSDSISVLKRNAATGEWELAATISLPAGSRPVAFGTFIQNVASVGIDIMPGGNHNAINLRAQGPLPVAILGSANFNVADVDPMTVTLAGSSVVTKKNGLPMASEDDVNGDGFMDLVLHVSRADLQLTAADTEATLAGKTNGGMAFQGKDSVKVIP